jgi:hypothetical protein
MSTASYVNRLPLLSAEVTMPRVGAWRADVEADGEDELSGKATIDLQGTKFLGTVVRSGVVGGRVRARIVGGAGGLAKLLPAKNYSGGVVRVSTVLADILRDSGEKVASTADKAITGRQLKMWQRHAGQASHALVTLLDAAQASFRVLADGTVWIGVDSYPEADIEHELLDEDWSTGSLTLAVEAPLLTPGTTFRAHRIEQVVHRLSRNALRTEAQLTSARSFLGTFLGHIRRHIDYSRTYPCRVVKQNADGSLQLMPDDAAMKGAGLDKVPIRHGLPGMKVKVPGGARAHLVFDAGDPARPFAALWEEGAVTSISFDNGQQPMARNGDLVQSGGVGTVVSFAPVTPAPGPMVPGVPYLISFSPIPPSPALASPLFGAIVTGNAKFTA